MAREGISENELIRRFRNGDGEALCALFDRYQALLEDRAGRYLSAAPGPKGALHLSHFNPLTTKLGYTRVCP